MFTKSLAGKRECSTDAPMELTSRERNRLTDIHSLHSMVCALLLEKAMDSRVIGEERNFQNARGNTKYHKSFKTAFMLQDKN